MSENPGVLVVVGGDKEPPLVEIGLTDMSKTGGLFSPPPRPPACDSPASDEELKKSRVSDAVSVLGAWFGRIDVDIQRLPYS